MDIIDSHVHIGLNSFFSGEGESKFPLNLENSFVDYLDVMKNSKVNRACILPIPASDFDHIKSNNYLEEAFNYSKGKLIPVCRLNDSLADNICGNFIAAKLHRVYDDIPSKQLDIYLKMLEYYKAPLIFHAAFKNKVKQVKDFLKKAPDLIVVLAHMGRGHIYTSEQVQENLLGLSDEKNVFFETSTVGNSATIAMACDIVGSSRIMFGSDYPFGKLYLGEGYSYDDELDVINNAKITASDKNNILSYTAQDVFFKGIRKREQYITLYQDIYKEDMNLLLKELNQNDRKFLALDKKISVIRDCMRKKAHIFVIVVREQFAGYIRESGRPNGISLLEEIVVLPKFRGNGTGRAALRFYKKIFPHNIAKTNAQNTAMIQLLETEGYRRDEGKRIINWEFINF